MERTIVAVAQCIPPRDYGLECCWAQRRRCLDSTLSRRLLLILFLDAAVGRAVHEDMEVERVVGAMEESALSRARLFWME